MKKIAEIHIGSNAIDYEKYGTPTLLINHTKKDKPWWRYYISGIFQAYCLCCGNAFTFSSGYSYQDKEITCPCCGKQHKSKEIMDKLDSNALLPIRMYMSLIEFKNKLELRVKYDAITLGENIFSDFKIKWDNHEKFVFDIKNSAVEWFGKVKDKDVSLRIGYFDRDYEVIYDLSVLQYFRFDHKIKKGNSFAELLKKLRESINTKMCQRGYGKKNLYINGTRKHLLLGSILNIAHKVRFWDFENIPLLSRGQYFTHNWLNRAVLIGENMKQDWLLEMEQFVKTGMNHQQALCKALAIPYIGAIRKELCFNNLYNLFAAYSLKNINLDLCHKLYCEFKKVDITPSYYDMPDDKVCIKHGFSIVRNLNEKQKIIAVLKKFYHLYPSLSINYIAKNVSLLYDAIDLYDDATAKNKQRIIEERIPFKKLHDWLALEVAKQDGNEGHYELPKQVLTNRNKQIGSYCFQVIEHRSSLVEAGICLKNCAIKYVKSINNDFQLITVKDRLGKMVALLRVNHNKIEEAKIFDNDPAYYNDEINNGILDYARETRTYVDTKDICAA